MVGRGHASYRTGGDGISATCRHGASHVDAHKLVKGVPHVQHIRYDAAARNECPRPSTNASRPTLTGVLR
jgi:hypothetical protein